MARYVHLASKAEQPDQPCTVEAHRFAHHARWHPPDAEKVSIAGAGNEPWIAYEHVSPGDWEVETGATLGTKKLIVPGLVFPLLYVLAEEPTP
jgi:hypothetical protein